jgi:hypothetical protein
VKVSAAAGTSELAITYLRTGDFAGEAALILDEPWPFTLQALEHVELVKMTREDFRRVLAAHPPIEEKLWAATLARLKQRGAALQSPVSSEYMRMAMDTGLIHGESVLLIDLATCTRCDECVRGCADAHATATGWCPPRATSAPTRCAWWTARRARSRARSARSRSRSIRRPASAARTARSAARGATS